MFDWTYVTGTPVSTGHNMLQFRVENEKLNFWIC